MEAAPRPFRRKVFYIPGYDPMSPRRYRELYRKEAALQAGISGYQISVKGEAGAPRGAYGWHVASLMEGEAAEAEIRFLLWNDLVRESMEAPIYATYLLLLRTAFIYIRYGVLWRLMRLRAGPVIAALYPVVMLLGQLAIGLLLGLGAAALGQGLAARFVPALAPLLWGGAPLVLWLVLRWFKARDNRLMAYYLLHDYAYSARLKGAYPSELRERLCAFREQIAQALREDVDEVLVVGHSSGAHLAVSVLADLLRVAPPKANGPQLALLSLGQVVPMVSFLPEAVELRQDLYELSQSRDVFWVDVSAIGDGCSFALCDPAGVSGVAPEGQAGPLIFSAAFRETLSPARYKKLRRRYFRLHFQYLCAFERVRDYDYFRITAGAQSLHARYAGRAASPSTLRRPVSPYRTRGGAR